MPALPRRELGATRGEETLGLAGVHPRNIFVAKEWVNKSVAPKRGLKPYPTTILAPLPTLGASFRMSAAEIATHPAVGVSPGRAM